MKTRLLVLGTMLAAAQGCNASMDTASSLAGSAGGGAAGSTMSTGGQSTSTSTGAGAGGSTATATGGAGGASTASGGTAGSTGAAGTGGGCAILRPCQAHVYECGDGVDNDGDGLVDEDDVDCLGACDNSESGLYPAVWTEQASGCGVDCFFDANGGPGDDECYWSHRCDPNEVAPFYYPEPNEGSYCKYDPAAAIPGTAATCAELHDAQSDICHQVCDALVPNGCDCFGCCELPAGSGKFVWLGSEDNDSAWTCDLASAGDPGKCHPCEPVPGCMNPCDTCELCVGKPALPAGCAPEQQCAPGLPPCQPGDPSCCPAGTYCVTGCCQPLPT